MTKFRDNAWFHRCWQLFNMQRQKELWKQQLNKWKLLELEDLISYTFFKSNGIMDTLEYIQPVITTNGQAASL